MFLHFRDEGRIVHPASRYLAKGTSPFMRRRNRFGAGAAGGVSRRPGTSGRTRFAP
jgi:hypothetical protein